MQGIGRASTAKMWLVGTAIGFVAFGGENVLPLEVAVHHDDGGSVPVNVADNDGHGGLRSVHSRRPPVAVPARGRGRRIP